MMSAEPYYTITRFVADKLGGRSAADIVDINQLPEIVIAVIMRTHHKKGYEGEPAIIKTETIRYKDGQEWCGVTVAHHQTKSA